MHWLLKTNISNCDYKVCVELAVPRNIISGGVMPTVGQTRIRDIQLESAITF